MFFCVGYVELVWDPLSHQQSACLSALCHRLKDDYSIFEEEQSKPVKVKSTKCEQFIARFIMSIKNVAIKKKKVNIKHASDKLYFVCICVSYRDS